MIAINGFARMAEEFRCLPCFATYQFWEMGAMDKATFAGTPGLVSLSLIGIIVPHLQNSDSAHQNFQQDFAASAKHNHGFALKFTFVGLSLGAN